MIRDCLRQSALLAGLLFLAPAIANDTVSIEFAKDRLGADYKGFAVGDDPEVCRNACASDAVCKSYTYVRAGVKGPDAMCFLKNAAPPPMHNNCCISGEKTTVAPVRIAPPTGGRPAPLPRAAAPTPAPLGPQLAAAFNPQRVEITPAISLAQIRALPPTTVVRLPSGREMTAEKYNKLADTFIAIRKAGLDRAPPPKSAFSRTKGPAQVQLRPGMDLKAVAQRPESDVVQLPTGEKFTVGDLKRLSAIEKVRTGRGLFDPPGPRPGLAGPSIKVTPGFDAATLARKPDTTVLEMPSGRRITLGELRAYPRTRAAMGAGQ